MTPSIKRRNSNDVEKLCHFENSEYVLCKEEDSVVTSLSQWMSNLPDHLTKIPINQLAIPGSHDSGAYYLDPNSPISSGQPKIIKKHGKHFKQEVINWSLTQKSSIAEQVRHGVRYFDMRTGYLASKDDFLFVHGIYGHTMTSLMKDIQVFLKENPREVVIIDFNHFYNFTDALHHRFVKSILSIFDGLIFTKENGAGVSSSLSEFWLLRKQVFVCYKPAHICSEYKELWPAQYISSPWFNRQSTSVLLTDLNKHLNEPKNGGKFNVSQSILTPSLKTVALNFHSSLREQLTIKCNEAVKRWLHELWQQRKQGINIVICDFICVDQCIPAILKLNEIIQS